MAAVLISATVGKGGRNILSDVKTVQTRLKAHGIDPGRIDGIAGAKTIAAIAKFQTGFLSRPDGVVEPGGTTWGYLKKAPGRNPPQIWFQTIGASDLSQWK